jgi:iron complex transport system substrate-binding protein
MPQDTKIRRSGSAAATPANSNAGGAAQAPGAAGSATAASATAASTSAVKALLRSAAAVLLAALAGVTATTPAQAQPPQRVISTDAAITEIVAALGEGRRLVAVDVTSTLPDGSAPLPRVGYHRALSAEGLLSLRPDLLLASEHAGPPEALGALRGAGVQVLTLPAALSPAVLADNVLQIAAALQVDATGKALAARVEATGAALKGAAAPGVSALLLRDGGGELRAAGRDTAGGAFLDLIGVANAADHDGYRTYSQEAILALNPPLLLLALGDDETAQSLLQRYPLLRFSDAAGSGSVLGLDSAALVGGLSLRALESASDMAPRLLSRAGAPGPAAPTRHPGKGAASP